MKTLIAAIALAGIAAPASAQEVRFEVEHRDLDLATTKGQKELEKRIDKATRRACDYDASATGSRIRSAETRACYVEMKTKAMQRFAALREREGKGG